MGDLTKSFSLENIGQWVFSFKAKMSTSVYLKMPQIMRTVLGVESPLPPGWSIPGQNICSHIHEAQHMYRFYCAHKRKRHARLFSG